MAKEAARRFVPVNQSGAERYVQVNAAHQNGAPQLLHYASNIAPDSNLSNETTKGVPAASRGENNGVVPRPGSVG